MQAHENYESLRRDYHRPENTPTACCQQGMDHSNSSTQNLALALQTHPQQDRTPLISGPFPWPPGSLRRRKRASLVATHASSSSARGEAGGLHCAPAKSDLRCSEGAPVEGPLFCPDWDPGVMRCFSPTQYPVRHTAQSPDLYKPCIFLCKSYANLCRIYKNLSKIYSTHTKHTTACTKPIQIYITQTKSPT